MAVAYAARSGYTELWHHLGEAHTVSLLMNLGFLIPGFSIVAAAFERCGVAEKIREKTDSITVILWIVYCLSIFLDNIAAAMIGGVLLKGKDPSFRSLVGVIAASNLGGAGSPIGDTTTVMMYVSTHPDVPTWQLFTAFAGSIPAMFFVAWWAKGADALDDSFVTVQPISRLETEVDGFADDVDALIEAEALHGTVETRWLWLLLGIPGLILGNVLADQPALGLWSGVVLGMVLAWRMPTTTEVWNTVPNAVFLVLLVAAAELLPLAQLSSALEVFDRDTIAILMGVLSPWFDNIPLTALCLRLDGFYWGLLAYTVGFGGSAMWFGSSAGVALSVQYPEVCQTKKWFFPFFVITTVFSIGCMAMLAAMYIFDWSA